MVGVLPLPLSVRLSLWGTRVLSGDLPSAAADRLVAPGLPRAGSVRPYLEMWQAFGERVVLVALPHPGRLAGMPPGPPGLAAAAAEAGECAYVPALGGALVPLELPAGDDPGSDDALHRPLPESGEDGGPVIGWQRFDSAPVEPWRLEGLSVREASRQLAEDTDAAIGVLSGTHQPWAWRGLRALADAALDSGDEGGPGLPPGLPAEVRALIARSAAAGEAARLGLEMPDDGTAAQARARTGALRALLAGADAALAAASCIGALHLAGMRPGHRDG